MVGGLPKLVFVTVVVEADDSPAAILMKLSALPILPFAMFVKLQVASPFLLGYSYCS